MRTAAKRGSMRTVPKIYLQIIPLHTYYLRNETVISTNFDASIDIASRCGESDGRGTITFLGSVMFVYILFTSA